MGQINNYSSKLHEVKHVDTIKEIISSSVTLFSDKPAFLTKDEKGGDYIEHTFAEFAADVDALGTKLLAMGLKDAKIAVIGENCYQWVVSYLATVNGTGIVVPLDKELGKEEIYNLIETAECQAVFYTASYEKIFADYNIPHKIKMEVYRNNNAPTVGVRWEELLEDGKKLLLEGNRDFVDAVIDPMEMKIMLFTSGTTGMAKAVMLCHKNIASNIMNTTRIVRLAAGDTALSILPIHHTFESTIGIMVMIYQGVSVAFFEGLKYVNKNMVESKCSILVGVPLIFESIYDKIWKQAEKTKKAKALKILIKMNNAMKAVGIDVTRKMFASVYKNFGGNLRFFVTGAAAIDPKVVRGFNDLGFEMVQGYGLTETSPLVTGTPDFTDRYKKAGSVGPVIPEGEIDIIDKNEEGIGEIIYKGPNVMMGYYNMPEETAEVLKDGWFHTGDLGFLDDEGWLYITGRKKNIIVTKTGKNIYPEEIEQYLKQIKYIDECMVYGTEDDDHDDTIVSVQIRPNYEFIYDEFGNEFDSNQIYNLFKENVSDINQSIPNYKRVRKVVIRQEEFIKTTTKKIKRQQNI